MDTIHDVWSEFVAALATVLLISCIVWMVGLVILLFREMFTSEVLVFRLYLRKVWEVLLRSFTLTAFIGSFLFPLMMWIRHEYIDYGFMTAVSWMLSGIYLYIRRKWRRRQKRKRESMEKEDRVESGIR